MGKLQTPKLETLPLVSEGTDTNAVFASIRRNFEELTRYFDANGQLNGFRALDFEVKLGADREKIAHSLGSIPRDVILLRLLAPTGTKLTFHHSLFTAADIVVSMTGSGTNPAKVRVLVGTAHTGEDSGEEFFSGAVEQQFKAIL